MRRHPTQLFACLVLAAFAVGACGDGPRGSAQGTSATKASPKPGSTELNLDHAIRSGTDIALSLDGKRVREAAMITHALDAMKAAPETAKKLKDIEEKCKLSLASIWDELRFSAKRSLGEGITYIRLNIPAEDVVKCFRSLTTDAKPTDIAGHAALLIPGEVPGEKPLVLVSEGQTLVLGTEGYVRDAMNGLPPDDVKAHALIRQGDELGRGVVTFEEGALTKVGFRITATGTRFEMIAEPDLENEVAATAFIALLDKTWSDAHGATNGGDLPAKPTIEREGTKIVITARVDGDATEQSRYLSGLSTLGFSTFQRYLDSRKTPSP